MIGNIVAAINSKGGSWEPTGYAYLWYDGSDTSTIIHSAGKVSQWNSKGSASVNVTQATAANQPSTNSVFLNGLNTISFDGGDVLLGTTKADWKYLNDGTKYVIGAVAKLSSVSNPDDDMYVMTNIRQNQGAVAGMAFGCDDFSIYGRNNRAFHNIQGAAAQVAYTAADNTWTPNTTTLFTSIADPGNATASERLKVYIGTGNNIGTNTATGTPDTSNPTYNMGIGATDNVLATIDGFIAEIVILTGSNATETNRVSLRDYLKTKWGL